MKVGHSVTFTIADNSVENIVKDRGYEVIVLHSDYDKMDDELPLWDVVDISNVDVVIVDSYYVTLRYLDSVRHKVNSLGGRLIYIDDVQAFAYPVDVLVNYNAYAEREAYEDLYNSSDIRLPKLILGPSYAPLREMFCNVSRREQFKTVENVLVSTGGSDELHLALGLARYICKSSCDQQYIYHFLIGGMNADRDKIYKLASPCDDVVIHENVSDMKSLITSVDLAVSAAGSTLYEICACGVPLITYVLADNQLLGAEVFERLGLAISVGDLRDADTVDTSIVMSEKLQGHAVERIMMAVEELGSNYSKRVDMGRRMQEMIDGRGAIRIVEEINK